MMLQGEFLELVRGSRTYRRFDEGRKVSMEQLLELVGVARLAPSGNNMQVLRFHCINDEDEVGICLAHHKWAGLIKDWDGPRKGERPVAYIAICGPRGVQENIIRNQDAGIAAQTIMLAARTCGLGGCMVKSYDAGLAEDLGLAERGLEIVLLLALGYPTERVILEEAADGVAYWHDEEDTNHVPKLSVDDLIV